MDLVYTVLDLSKPEGDQRVPPYHEGVEGARRRAEKMVGNRACSHPPGSDLYFYGPGNGDTTVIVRGVFRDWLPEDAEIVP